MEGDVKIMKIVVLSKYVIIKNPKIVKGKLIHV